MPKIVFATMTQSGDDFEKHFHTLEEVKHLGYDIALVYRTKATHSENVYDGYRLDEKDLKKVESLGIKTHRTQRAGSIGVGNAIKDAIRYAYELVDDNGAIIYSEPDKFDIVKDAERMAEPILSRKSLVSIIGRTQRSKDTYPKFQKFEEEYLVAQPWSFALGKPVDIFFSPQAYSKEVAPHFYNWEGKDWGIHFAPLLELSPDKIDNSVVLDSYDFPETDYLLEEGNPKFQLYRLNTIKQCVVAPFKKYIHLNAIAIKVEQIVNDLEDKIKSAGLTEQDINNLENLKF